mmetsp:Transcript_2421/g.7497  ORF Transcript_2421/g.7497 Transcript_2421/m.7497 type:complete len:380 (+) Transcript_2421:746-1885(+)
MAGRALDRIDKSVGRSVGRTLSSEGIWRATATASVGRLGKKVALKTAKGGFLGGAGAFGVGHALGKAVGGASKVRSEEVGARLDEVGERGGSTGERLGRLGGKLSGVGVGGGAHDVGRGVANGGALPLEFSEDLRGLRGGEVAEGGGGLRVELERVERAPGGGVGAAGLRRGRGRGGGRRRDDAGEAPGPGRDDGGRLGALGPERRVVAGEGRGGPRLALGRREGGRVGAAAGVADGLDDVGRRVADVAPRLLEAERDGVGLRRLELGEGAQRAGVEAAVDGGREERGALRGRVLLDQVLRQERRHGLVEALRARREQGRRLGLGGRADRPGRARAEALAALRLAARHELERRLPQELDQGRRGDLRAFRGGRGRREPV